MDLSIVIPAHNRPDLLRACLESVLRHCPARSEIVVVDDGSPQRQISAVVQQFPAVRGIRLERRQGFCAAANAGIAASRGMIVELLNDDTEVTAQWADFALTHFAEAGVAAVAPLVLRWPGGEVGTAVIDSAGDRYYRGGIAGKRGHNEPLEPVHLSPCEVFGASASSAFYRREVLLRVGAFPIEFGAYFEDVDLAFRLHRAGGRILYEPRSRVLHHVSASHGAKPDRPLLRQQSRNEERVFWRNLPAGELLRSLPFHLAVLVAKGVRRWRAGELAPYVLGRLDLLREVRSLVRHRRQLQALGKNAPLEQWQVERTYWE